MIKHNGKSSANAQSSDRPAQHSGSITFTGNFLSTIRAKGLAVALAENRNFEKMLDFVDKKEATFGAIVNLGLLTTVKPMLTLVMPAAEGKDKVSVASKEIVGGLVSFGLANLITSPLEIGVIKVTKNPAKYVGSNNLLLKRLRETNFASTFATIYKNSPEVVNACLKGALTVAFMPPVIALIDKLRNKKKPPKVIKPEDLFISEKLRRTNGPSGVNLKGGI